MLPPFSPSDKKIKTSIIGATGYTGIELIRILLGHPFVELSSIFASSNAGLDLGEVYPHISHLDLPILQEFSPEKTKNDDVLFFCLPHATSQKIISEVQVQYPSKIIIDLSADFRLNNIADYEKYYGTKHLAQDLQKKATYGLSEIYHDKIADSNLIACPGCFPTSILLPLIPLLAANMIDWQNSGIIIDAKTGITGAGRKANIDNLFAEVNQNIRPYGISGHRHISEIIQELNLALNVKQTHPKLADDEANEISKTPNNPQELQVNFLPQIISANRGILSNIYVRLQTSITAIDAKQYLQKYYHNSDFVIITNGDTPPNLRDVVHTNLCKINIFPSGLSGGAVIISAIDNLKKGAAGQAMQNMNIRLNIPQTTGLGKLAIFP
jgi:N-acetyl-gamma-glutamyl-phosphate reductase